MGIFFNAFPASGNFNGSVAGTVKAGTTLQVNNGAQRRIEHLSALVVLEAETTNVTLRPKWQVSNDGTTFYDVIDQVNGAATVQATGTAGNDAVISRVVSAPPSVYGWTYARCVAINAVQTGNTTDTYAIGYNYVSFDREMGG